jgi:hypothetical protein
MFCLFEAMPVRVEVELIGLLGTGVPEVPTWLDAIVDTLLGEAGLALGIDVPTLEPGRE